MAKSRLAKMSQKIESKVVGGYKKIENGTVGGFWKIADKFVDNYLTKEGESIEDAKKRIAEEQRAREAKAQQDILERKKMQEEIVTKNLAASLNAGRM